VAGGFDEFVGAGGVGEWYDGVYDGLHCAVGD